MVVFQDPAAAVEAAKPTWDAAVDIWLKGGWAMIAIAVIAFVMFAVGVQVHLTLRRKGHRKVDEKTWRRWINHPEDREGPIGEMLDFVSGGTTLEQTTMFFEQLHMAETQSFDRDLRVMNVCVKAAPLVGLLGTVTGMLTTFGAISTGSGGDQTIQAIAGGISEALITTETGLVIALPGLFFQYQLSRRVAGYKMFLAHLESVCTQSQYRRIQRSSRGLAERVARSRIADQLRKQLQLGSLAGRIETPKMAANGREYNGQVS